MGVRPKLNPSISPLIAGKSIQLQNTQRGRNVSSRTPLNPMNSLDKRSSSVTSYESNLPDNDPNAILNSLVAGNMRFINGATKHPNASHKRLMDLATNGQNPMVTVLTCADSRVPVELIFDVGFGDIFVIRAAGAVPGPDQLGSLEYAVHHLHVPLIVIMGHTKCGAIAAALSGSKEEGNLSILLERLKPTVDAVFGVEKEKKAEAALKKSVELIQHDVLNSSPVLKHAIHAGHAKMVGAIYNIESGKVYFQKEIEEN